MQGTRILVTVCLISIAASMGAGQERNSIGAAGSKVRQYPGYELAWSDEFNKDGRPDPGKWTYERGFVRNEELQWYSSDNARCEDGFLLIEGRRERKANPGYDPESSRWSRKRKYCEYTSASMTTKGLHNWRYGRF
jgi:beta-glucanase (GH16 family)